MSLILFMKLVKLVIKAGHQSESKVHATNTACLADECA